MWLGNMTKTQSTVLCTILTGLCVLVSYLWVDLPVIVFFYSFRETAFSEAFEIITTMGESQWYLVAGLILWIVYRKKSNRLGYGGMLLLSSVALSGIGVNLLKSLLGRARPHLYLKDNIYGFDFFHMDYSWLSFPSGHAATALGAASALALLYPQYKLPIYATGTIIAFSRIVLTQHYPSDVILGSLLGYMTTMYLYHRFFKEKMHDPSS